MCSPFLCIIYSFVPEDTLVFHPDSPKASGYGALCYLTRAPRTQFCFWLRHQRCCNRCCCSTQRTKGCQKICVRVASAFQENSGRATSLLIETPPSQLNCFLGPPPPVSSEVPLRSRGNLRGWTVRSAARQRKQRQTKPVSHLCKASPSQSALNDLQVVRLPL